MQHRVGIGVAFGSAAFEKVQAAGHAVEHGPAKTRMGTDQYGTPSLNRIPGRRLTLCLRHIVPIGGFAVNRKAWRGEGLLECVCTMLEDASVAGLRLVTTAPLRSRLCKW